MLGRFERGWVVTSETAALDIVGASFMREIEPGELIAIDEGGLRRQLFAAAEPKGCLFEYVYLARPDTTIAGRVYSARVEVGRVLAKRAALDGDLVIPPESGTPPAIGFAEASGIPYGMGLVKNSYVGRTFIQPCQTIRQLGIRLKLNPLRDVIRGKRLVVVNDSIVRGNTQRGGGTDAARSWRRGSARQDLLASGEVAVLLRHRLRLPGRAHRQRTERRRDPGLDRRGHARLSRWTAWWPPASSPGAGSAGHASTASTRSRCPADRQAPAGRNRRSAAGGSPSRRVSYPSADALTPALTAALPAVDRAALSQPP